MGAVFFLAQEERFDAVFGNKQEFNFFGRVQLLKGVPIEGDNGPPWPSPEGMERSGIPLRVHDMVSHRSLSSGSERRPQLPRPL